MEFKSRFARACAANADVPEYGHGQQVYIAKAVGVSQEAVRKWFAGESQPRKATMELLANLLKVEHVWLSLGVEHSETNRFREVARRQDADLYALTSYLISAGGGVAFEKSETASADITCVINGEILMFKCVTGTQKSNHEYVIDVPVLNENKSVIQVACIQCPDWVFNWAFIDISVIAAGSHSIVWQNDTFKIGTKTVENLKIGNIDK
jgi:transcriptional regulator with XRE-family HTH domain